jgi:hypothetical protein
MTREEAIKNLEEMIEEGWLISDFVEPCEMAIKALKREPCDGAISRQAVLDIVRFENKWLFDARSNNVDTDIAFDGIISKIYDLPPIQPKIKTGYWIPVTNGRGGHECSLCHEYAPSYQNGDEWITKHCPNCGAKMEVNKE